jgi:hypothetical protein
LLNLIATRKFDVQDFAAYSGAVVVGTVIAPTLLPIIPGKALAWKGWLPGLLWTAFIAWAFGWFADSLLLAIGYLLLLPAISSYLTMNFTGSTPYTSHSGVLKEMKLAIPLQAIFAAAGLALVLIKTFIA